MSEAVASSPFMKSYIVWFNRIVTTVIYMVYPALLIMLYLQRETIPFSRGLIPAILIPGISFVLLSIFRHFVNSPRPYEVFDLTPIIDKKTAGHSFPSRHIFSVFIIATTCFYYYPLVGVLIGLTGAALALNRVLGGVHFIKDVVAGALIGIGCGVVGFYIILPLFL